MKTEEIVKYIRIVFLLVAVTFATYTLFPHINNIESNWLKIWWLTGTFTFIGYTSAECIRLMDSDS